MNIKKAIGVSKSVVATISHNEFKDVLMDNKCLRHQLIEFKVKINKMKSKFHCLVLMTNYISKTMDMMD